MAADAAGSIKGVRLRRGLCRRVASLRSGGDIPAGLRVVVAADAAVLKKRRG